jgi:hypothetical protein
VEGESSGLILNRDKERGRGSDRVRRPAALPWVAGGHCGWWGRETTKQLREKEGAGINCHLPLLKDGTRARGDVRARRSPG